MKKLRGLIVALTVAGCVNGTTFGESEIEFEITSAFFSKYILRGQNLDDEPVLQSGISARYGGLTALIWNNFELTNINGNKNEVTEVDCSLDYSGLLPGIEGVKYSTGAIHYTFPGTKVKDTTEIYWGFNFDLPLSPSITVYHDVYEAGGMYVSLAGAHRIEKIFEFEPNMPVGMEIGAALGWGSRSYNDYYWGTDQSKLNDLTLSVSFPVEIAGWSVAPSLNYVTLLSNDIRDADMYGTESDFFFVGVSLSKSF
jgi:hypothetical protein